MTNFNLKQFQNGLPVKTVSGRSVKYIALLENNVPAPLVVEVGGKMENYFTNGSFLGTPSDDDLQMVSLPETRREHVYQI